MLVPLTREVLLAELAVEHLPDEADRVRRDFRVQLVLEPLLEAHDVDVLHRAGAGARAHERVVLLALLPETDAARDLLVRVLRDLLL